MSITSYRTLLATSASDLDSQVAAAIANSLQPSGDRIVLQTPSGPSYQQVVVGSSTVPQRGQIFNAGGLVIKAGGSALAKTANTVYGSIGPSLFSKAAADMAALSGSVANGKYNVFAFTVAADGTLATTMGTEGATLAAVVFPPIPSTVALLGFVVIHPTGTGAFVGGTTALDDGTVVPNAVFKDTVGDFLQPQ